MNRQVQGAKISLLRSMVILSQSSTLKRCRFCPISKIPIRAVSNGSRHHVKRWSQHRPDMLTDPNYWTDEDIEECLE